MTTRTEITRDEVNAILVEKQYIPSPIEGLFFEVTNLNDLSLEDREDLEAVWELDDLDSADHFVRLVQRIGTEYIPVKGERETNGDIVTIDFVTTIYLEDEENDLRDYVTMDGVVEDLVYLVVQAFLDNAFGDRSLVFLDEIPSDLLGNKLGRGKDIRFIHDHIEVNNGDTRISKEYPHAILALLIHGSIGSIYRYDFAQLVLTAFGYSALPFYLRAFEDPRVHEAFLKAFVMCDHILSKKECTVTIGEGNVFSYSVASDRLTYFLGESVVVLNTHSSTLSKLTIVDSIMKLMNRTLTLAVFEYINKEKDETTTTD